MDEQAEALYGGGCSDGTLRSSDGHARIGFDREAPSPQDAIASAVADVRRANLQVDRIEIEAEELAAELSRTSR